MVGTVGARGGRAGGHGIGQVIVHSGGGGGGYAPEYVPAEQACLVTGRLKTAALYLLVLQNLVPETISGRVRPRLPSLCAAQAVR